MLSVFFAGLLDVSVFVSALELLDAVDALSDLAPSLAVAFEPVDFVLDDQADVVIWQKAAFNCALNTISALCGARVGDIANEPSAVVLAKAAADEVVDVANAKVRERIEPFI